MKGIVKANTVDKYLRPIRHQIVNLIEPKSTVLDFGCGNGDLLFKLGEKIHMGIGFDKSASLIDYASTQQENKNLEHISFRNIDFTKGLPEIQADYSIASLLLHILNWEEAIELLQQMVKTTETTIVCGFSKPDHWKQQLLLWLDQRFTGHYHNFSSYQKRGYTEGLLNAIEGLSYERFDTFDPVIKLYRITSDQSID